MLHLLAASYTYTTQDSGAFGALFAVYLLFIAFLLVAMWRLFTKAGEPGWAAIVPIYSTIVLLKIAGRPWWWIFLLWTVVIPIIALNDLSKSFGKDSAFTVGLLFLSFIFFPILAFGSATYIGPRGIPGGPGRAGAPPPPPLPPPPPPAPSQAF